MLYAGGSQYEGQWFRNKRNGTGKMIYSNKDIYEGEWLWDQKHGTGTY